MEFSTSRILPVNEVFRSIDGEGIRTGLPVVFVRLYGCNLRCNYCDTCYAIENSEFYHMSIAELVEHVNLTAEGCKRVTLTGGEPLMYEATYDLVYALVAEGYEVNIETNGTWDPRMFTMNRNVIVTMDHKCKGSGVSPDRTKKYLYPYLREQDVLKFVVSSVEDLEEMKDILQKYPVKCHVFVSPCFGRIDPKDIVKCVQENHMWNVHVQVQLHKVIWDPEERGV